MHHHNRTHDETTKPHLASTRSKLRQEDQRLAGEQATRSHPGTARAFLPADCLNCGELST